MIDHGVHAEGGGAAHTPELERGPLGLGASLYVPASRTDLALLGRGQKLPWLRSLIYCTEDAVRRDHLDAALTNLESALDLLDHTGPSRFVRVRDPAVMKSVLSMNVRALHGLVLPKVHSENLHGYLDVLPADTHLRLMVTLEDVHVLSEARLAALRDQLLAPSVRERILCVRIGGNDLLALLGLRRERGVMMYDTPLGHVIDRIVVQLKPFGFAVSAPVYDFVDDPQTLRQETRIDVQRGLFGKTAIHPLLVAVIESCYRVTVSEHEAARAILADDAPAVFLRDGRMCEPSTHRRWARDVMVRARLYGVGEGASFAA